MISTQNPNFHNPASLDIWARIPHRLHMEKRNKVDGMPTDKSCWTRKYMGNWTGDTFVQDFTCTWFPKHDKGKEKKSYSQKDPDEGCKFWEERKGSN